MRAGKVHVGPSIKVKAYWLKGKLEPMYDTIMIKFDFLHLDRQGPRDRVLIKEVYGTSAAQGNAIPIHLDRSILRIFGSAPCVDDVKKLANWCAKSFNDYVAHLFKGDSALADFGDQVSVEILGYVANYDNPCFTDFPSHRAESYRDVCVLKECCAPFN